MTKLLFMTLLILTITIPVSGVGAAADNAWVVIDQQEYSVDGQPIALSPDGKWLAGTGEETNFCVWSLPDLDEYCDDATFTANESTVVWAPDSSQVAFAGDPAKYLVDSDIVVFDVESKRITNLTDDPDEVQDPDIFSKEPRITHADTFPLWSGNGESLFFIRGDFGSEQLTTQIMSLEVASGEIKEYFTISPDRWFTVYSPIFELPDGSLLISVGNYDEDKDQNGIWKVAPDGKRIDPVLESGNEESLQALSVSDVSSDGTMAIVYSAQMSFDSPWQSPYMLLDLESGEYVSFFHPDLKGSSPDPWGNPQFIGTSTELVYRISLPDSSDHGLAVGLTDPYTLVESLGESYNYVMRASDDGSILILGDKGDAMVVQTEWSGEEGTPPAPCSCTPPPEN